MPHPPSTDPGSLNLEAPNAGELINPNSYNEPSAWVRVCKVHIPRARRSILCACQLVRIATSRPTVRPSSFARRHPSARRLLAWQHQSISPASASTRAAATTTAHHRRSRQYRTPFRRTIQFSPYRTTESVRFRDKKKHKQANKQTNTPAERSRARKRQRVGRGWIRTVQSADNRPNLSPFCLIFSCACLDRLVQLAAVELARSLASLPAFAYNKARQTEPASYTRPIDSNDPRYRDVRALGSRHNQCCKLQPSLLLLVPFPCRG